MTIRPLPLALSIVTAVGGCSRQQAAPPPPVAGDTTTAALILTPETLDALFASTPADDLESDAAVARFVEIASRQDAPSALRVFHDKESDFAQRRIANPNAKMRELIAASESLRLLARATLGRATALAEAGDAAGARRHLDAVLAAADANSWPGVVEIGRITADSLRKGANEVVADVSPAH